MSTLSNISFRRFVMTLMILICSLSVHLSEEVSTRSKDNHEPRYEHEWPKFKFGWKIVVGSLLAFLGAAMGSVGGAGGGGVFLPMLALIIGFDPKSSTAISKCMIAGQSAATLCYNMRRRHPTLELPLIDYDLALLFQPMLLLGISIGVYLNVIFPDWLITVLIIILFIGISVRSFRKGATAWRKETIQKREAARQLELNAAARSETNDTRTENEELTRPKVSFIDNIRWMDLGILVVVWIIILTLQIIKNYSTTCSATFWILNVLQIPVAVGASAYEAICLYNERRRISALGDVAVNWTPQKLLFYCALGLLAGILGGMLGIGGGFILGPLFVEIGIPPQVSSATTIFVLFFSASMSGIEYYLLKRFPLPYALYLAGVTSIAAFIGQYVLGRLLKMIGRASIIIFILAGMTFGSAITLGGLGIAKMVKRIQRKEYMGFDGLCSYQT